MVLKIDLPAMARQNTRRKSLLMNPVVITQGIEDELYAIYADSLSVWREWIKRIGEAYTRPAPMVADADGQELGWLIDQADAAANNRLLYQTEKLGRWVTRVGTWHDQKTISAAKSATGVEISPYIRIGDIRTQLDAAIRENVGLISNVNADTKRRVEQVMFDAIANRRNQRYVTVELSKALGITQKRARRIARDQTHKLSSQLTQLRNEQLGISSYIWVTRHDERVRPAHRERDGKRFLWSKPPFDGHPGYPIMCFKGSAKLNLSNGCNKLWRRLYEGPMVSIMTGSGGLLEATPNHPILTSRGWIAINDIQEGDYLVKRALNGSLIQKNDHDILETTFDDFFNSVKASEPVKSSSGSKFDFHGDGSEGNVDTIDVNGLLKDSIRMPAFNHVEKLNLSGPMHNSSLTHLDIHSRLNSTGNVAVFSSMTVSFMRRARSFFSLFRSHISHHDIVGVFAASNGNSSLNKAIENTGPIPVKVSSDGKDAFSSFISGLNQVGRNICFVPWAILKFINGAVEVRSIDAEGMSERARVAAKNGSSFFYAGTSRYEFDYAVKKTVSVFTGHVYNISNDAQWYLSDNYIAHNCRCTAQGILIHDEDD